MTPTRAPIRWPAVVVAAFAFVSPAPGQAVVEATEEGKRALAGLIDQCRRAGAAEEFADEETGKRYLRLTDPGKLPAAVAGQRARLTPALRDALFYRARFVTPEQPALRALLHLVVEETDDDRGRAFESLLTAGLARRRADYEAAARAFEGAARLFGRLGDVAWQAHGRNQRGLALDELGRRSESVREFQEALRLYTRAEGAKGANVAACTSNLAAVLVERGEYAEALALFEKARRIEEEVHGDEDFRLGATLANMGAAYFHQGDFDKARRQMQKAVVILRAAPAEHKHLLARVLTELAIVHQSLEQPDKALERHEEALTIARGLSDVGDQPLAAFCLLRQAEFWSDQGEPGRARDLLRHCLEIQNRFFRGDHGEIAGTLTALGKVSHELGDSAGALKTLAAAAAMYRRLHGDRHPDLALTLSHLGTINMLLGRHVEAVRLYDEGLRALRAGAVVKAVDNFGAGDLRPLPLTVELLSRRGLALERGSAKPATRAELERCERTYRLAGAVLEHVRQGIRSDDSKALQAAQRFELFPRWLGVLGQLAGPEGRPEPLRAAFAVVEQASARVLLEQLGRSRARILGGVDEAPARREVELTQEIEDVDRRIDREQSRPEETRDAAAIGRLLDERARLEKQVESLVADMGRAYPQYAALKYPKPCSLEDARACLGENEVALLYVPGEESSHLLVVAKPEAGGGETGLALYRLPGVGEISAAVDAVTDPEALQRPAKLRPLAAAAYDLLLGPLGSRLRGKDLVVVPGGVLGYLPFELLLEGGAEDGRFLAETHRVRYAPSLTVLHHLRRWERKRVRPTEPFWGVGDPVPGKFAPLPGSGDEVRAVGALFQAPPGNLLLGAAARESRVKKASKEGQLAKVRFLHFAVHGDLGFAVGRQPGLVLSQVPDGGEDGFLRLDEVAGLKLNADLAVLSACQSGRGRLYQGEGVVGLPRAFLYAGCRGVVCSLWSVADQDTAEFMKTFYGRLAEGTPAGGALKEARSAMIRRGKAAHSWAPFILVGE